jgi:hypothetical protein
MLARMFVRITISFERAGLGLFVMRECETFGFSDGTSRFDPQKNGNLKFACRDDPQY